MTYAADLARAGVEALLWMGAYFHSKTICVDSRICSIGSANIDMRSFSICVPFSTSEYGTRPTSTG
jgi:cardiolipin synthase